MIRFIRQQYNNSNTMRWFMGSGGGGSSSSKTVDTKLSNAQLGILQSREADYQNFFSPILQNKIAEANGDTVNTAYLRSATQAVQHQAKQAKIATTQQMAQRGLSGSGVEAQAFSTLNNQRNQALGNAFYSASNKQDETLAKYMSLGLSMSPTPTTASPMGQVSESTNAQANVLG